MDEKNTKDPQTPKDKKRGFNFYWIYGLLTIAIVAIGLWGWQPSTVSIDNVKLERMIAQGDIEKIVIVKQKEQAQIYLRPLSINADSAYKKAFDRSKNGPHFYIDIADIATFSQEIKEAEEKAFQRDTAGKTPEEKIFLEENFKHIVVLSDNTKKWGWEILGWILPFLLIFGFFYWSMRGIGKAGGGAGGQIFNIGKSKAQLYDKTTQPPVTFNDVAGLESAKEEIVEIVDFLKNPQRYTNLGGKIPKGALLVGPPGTGKTLLARAVAGEAKVPFFSLSGSDFVEMFVGVGASRVRDLFKTAKEKAPCIIFIDEIDAVGRARGRNALTGANDERENTLNQLLTEMDGFSTNAGIIMLAATNRADILDRALLRAGRFDRQIHVELPDVEERIEIFKVHIRPLKLSKNVDIEFFARQTPGFSGADIANVCNEAALVAARKNKAEIEKEDFLSAIDRIIGGLERRSKIISPKEKRVIAFHEAGHATVSWLLEHASPLVKVTIVPRGKSLGAAWYLPEERQITNTDQLMDEISATLGGRAAEDVMFGKISTGALNDLERVTKQAYAMVMYYGLNEKIGNLSYYDSSGQSEYSFSKPYSETTAKLIDEEVHKLIDTAYQRAKDILTTHKEQLTKLATQLLEKEVIYREDLVEVFGERPFDSDNKIIKNNNTQTTETPTEEKDNSVDF
ncbi:MAG: ATP-dependent zinc metalloprotease FtsH [Bacteroidales bacterium]|jgi:ATP-dependent metalloprotease FtsH|nr:ATP-dependent zinc metalloprotease FtsH [Bacteroidales bacterium]MDD2688218.1 ATP-dependent zinc metalloprotease FtsH [Bacteroidales bacterium]MDD3330528.1 ATP-dependent zinc metalloprotease FtsH [Bacteroidales bacterium]MDD4044744.1 ATP-dependent zinc metalloprotease FtsH [Bacteroidales bacterium]MDD4582144.1 ATP-dependent zinc metalloprotease FtsH [Bacteroidales bacterium]